MTDLPDLPAGVWRHWKGPLYQVLGYGHDSNDADRAVVVYIGLQLDGAHTGPRLAVRTAEDFHAWVHPADGDTCPGDRLCARRDAAVPRFTYVGPSWEGRKVGYDEGPGHPE